VSSIKDFGAFVEILPGKDGLVHISELSEGYVGSVADVCRVGDTMLVKVILVDDQDRVKLSRKAALAERGHVDTYALNAPARPPAGERHGGGGDRDRGHGGPPRRGPDGHRDREHGERPPHRGGHRDRD
jgi:polyribonucleotide nucleotidyltransferase